MPVLCSNLTSLARRADSSKNRQLLKTCDWEKLEILLVLSLSLSLSLTHTHIHTRVTAVDKSLEKILRKSLSFHEKALILRSYSTTPNSGIPSEGAVHNMQANGATHLKVLTNRIKLLRWV
jgi:hypothetical protein